MPPLSFRAAVWQCGASCEWLHKWKKRLTELSHTDPNTASVKKKAAYSLSLLLAQLDDSQMHVFFKGIAQVRQVRSLPHFDTSF